MYKTRCVIENENRRVINTVLQLSSGVTKSWMQTSEMRSNNSSVRTAASQMVVGLDPDEGKYCDLESDLESIPRCQTEGCRMVLEDT